MPTTSFHGKAGQCIQLQSLILPCCHDIRQHCRAQSKSPEKNNRNRKKDKTSSVEVLNRKNNSQRGMRGIHVGLPRHSPGYLVYVPSTGRIYNTMDVDFDEDFSSTLTYEENKFSGYTEVTITESPQDTDLPIHHTGSPFIYARRFPAGEMRFTQPEVRELYDEDLNISPEPEPTLEEITGHRVKDQTLELQVKFVEDDEPCWIPISELYDDHPRAVREYSEENKLNDIGLSPPTSLKEASTSEEDINDNTDHNNDKNDGGEGYNVPL